MIYKSHIWPRKPEARGKNKHIEHLNSNERAWIELLRRIEQQEAEEREREEKISKNHFHVIRKLIDYHFYAVRLGILMLADEVH